MSPWNDGIKCIECQDEDVRVLVVDTEERKIIAMACRLHHLAVFMARTKELGERRYICGYEEALRLTEPNS